MRQGAILAGAVLAAALGVCPAAALDIRAAVVRVDHPRLAPISRFEELPGDMGFAGGRLGDEDNGTTGSFIGLTFVTEYIATDPEHAVEEVRKLRAAGIGLIVTLAGDAESATLADAAGPEALVLNAGSHDDALRGEGCRSNLLHIAPSRAMLTDAAAEFAIWKRWPKWFLIHGSNPDDLKLAEAWRRSAAKFGAKIVEEREFQDTGGSRRTDTGYVQVQQQIPVFTQDAREHDLVIAADASDVFAPYLPFHLWTPRPVMGSAGLRPVTFHGAHEAWGATQFQTRFEKLAGRYVREEDYQVWLALRVIGEAAVRTQSDDIKTLRAYMLGPKFGLAAFKGQPVSFRDWDGQLRQPILLYDGRITVSVSPQDGFLHQTSALDTLGIDRPETKCTAFRVSQ